jgi:hypothetical protein
MFANPLGLLGLLSLAAILGLHLYRRRRTPLVVSAAFLWEDVASEAQGGRQRQPLRKTLSLLAELLGALCLTLALAGLRMPGNHAAAHYVAVIDSSASLDAKALDGSTARDRARAEIAGTIRRLGPDGRVTLILTGPEPVVLAGPFAFRDEALEKLADRWPIQGSHSPTSALLLASELSALGPIDFATDVRPQDTDARERVRWIAVGEPSSNVGITAALREAHSSGSDEITLAIRNGGPKAREVRLELTSADADGAAPTTSDYVLAGNETRTVKFRYSPASADVIARVLPMGGKAELDRFPIDDAAYLCAAPRKTLRLASELSASAARDLGLRNAASAERWAEIVTDAEPVSADAAPHLVITASAVAAPAEDAPWTLSLQSEVASPSHLTGPFLLDATHPLLRGVTLDGVVWSMDEAAAASGPQVASVLAYAGDVPLVTESIRTEGGRDWRLLVDPELSNIGRSADWPILLSNAAEERRRALPGPVATSLGLGERFQWRGAPEHTLELVSPSGAVQSLAPPKLAELTTPRLGEVGVWELRTPEGKRLQTIGVSLVSSVESDLSVRASLAAPALDMSTLDNTTKGGTRTSWLETALLIMAAAFFALNWWALRDRGPAGARSGGSRT